MQCRTAGNDLPWSGLCNVVTVVATLTHIYIYHKNVNYLLCIQQVVWCVLRNMVHYVYSKQGFIQDF